MSSVLENHMLIGRATPVEETSGTFDEYFRLRDLSRGDYQYCCVDWLNNIPSQIKTRGITTLTRSFDAVVGWVLDIRDGWKFTETEEDLRAAVANAILTAGDMHKHGIDPYDNGEGGQAAAVCDAILRNKQRRW